MGRIYSINFTGGATGTAAGGYDLLECLAAAGKPFCVHEIVATQSSDAGDAASEQILITLKRATGSYTSGSGGSTATIGKANTSDTTGAMSAESMNTTRAVAGTGTLTVLRSEAVNIMQGYQYLPTPETRLFFAPAEALIVGLETAVADSLTMVVTAVVEELG